MIRSMYSGVSGLKAHQTKMDVIGNNVANVNTYGYKSQRVAFSDIFSQTISSGSASTDVRGSTNIQQIGLGVTVSGVDTNWETGAPTAASGSLNVAIDGEGFFAVQDGTGATMYTRVGNFSVDAVTGNLITADGYYVLDDSGSAITIDTTFTNYSIDANGQLQALDDQGAPVSDLAFVGVSNFINPSGLEKLGGGYYRQTASSGEVISNDELKAGLNGTGTLKTGYLESSNVDLATEFTDMIVTQRGYQANSRVITTSDTLLEELINIKR